VEPSIGIGIDPSRLVFIDETWTKTNMAPLRGWAPRASTHQSQGAARPLADHDLHAALRHDRITAPWFIERPDQRRGVPSLTSRKVLVPTLRQGDIVIMDNLGSHKANAVRRAIRAAAPALLPAEILTRSEPDRAVLRPSSNTGCAKPHSEPTEAVYSAIGPILETVHRPNAPITSPTPDMTKPNPSRTSSLLKNRLATMWTW